MVQVPEEEWAEIQRRLNPPARERLSESEVIDRYAAARRAGPNAGQLFRHKGTGGLYQVVAVALVEATLEPIVVYAGCGDFRGNGPAFTRPLAEFADRFVAATR